MEDLPRLAVNVAVIAAILGGAACLGILKWMVVAQFAVLYSWFFYEFLVCGSDCFSPFPWLFWTLLFTLPFGLLVAPIERTGIFILIAMVVVAGWTLVEWLARRRRRL